MGVSDVLKLPPSNKISGITLALEVCYSSQSVVFNSLTGLVLGFKCRTAVDGVKKCMVCECFCVSAVRECVCVFGGGYGLVGREHG